jgi:hypothetical protein
LTDITDGPQRALFLSNNLKWQARSIADFTQLNKAYAGPVPRSLIAATPNIAQPSAADHHEVGTRGEEASGKRIPKVGGTHEQFDLQRPNGAP